MLSEIGSTDLLFSLPALWSRNVITDAYLDNVELDAEWGDFVSANYSQITQDLDYSASYEDDSSLQPEVPTRVTRVGFDG